MLKGFNSHGTIGRKEESIKAASIYLGISPTSLRNHLSKLVKVGLVIKHKYSYSLISYDKAWELLGVDVSPNPKKDRLGDFKIFKIKSTENFKESVEFSEIVTQVSRQAFQSRKSILKNPKNFSDTEIKALQECKLVDLPELLDSLYVEKLSVLKSVEDYLVDIDKIEFCQKQGKSFSFNKITPYLTCERTSIVLGYQSNSRTGQNIRKRIQSAGLARFELREAYFLDTREWSNAVVASKMVEKYPSRIFDNGMKVSHRLISKMVVL